MRRQDCLSGVLSASAAAITTAPEARRLGVLGSHAKRIQPDLPEASANLTVMSSKWTRDPQVQWSRSRSRPWGASSTKPLPSIDTQASFMKLKTGTRSEASIDLSRIAEKNWRREVVYKCWRSKGALITTRELVRRRSKLCPSPG